MEENDVNLIQQVVLCFGINKNSNLVEVAGIEKRLIFTNMS